MSQKSNTQFLFTIIPLRLMREHNLLTSAERDILIQIISFGKSGCFYSIENWRKITERGDQAIYRGLYKLQLLGIISIYKGNRRAYSNQNTSNLYRYKPNPADWNLPIFLQDKLNSDLKAMDKEPIQFKEGFKSLNHFIHSFNTLHPIYAIKVIGETDPTPEAIDQPTIEETTEAEKSAPHKKIDLLEVVKSLGLSAIPKEPTDKTE